MASVVSSVDGLLVGGPCPGGIAPGLEQVPDDDHGVRGVAVPGLLTLAVGRPGRVKIVFPRQQIDQTHQTMSSPGSGGRVEYSPVGRLRADGIYGSPDIEYLGFRPRRRRLETLKAARIPWPQRLAVLVCARWLRR